MGHKLNFESLSFVTNRTLESSSQSNLCPKVTSVNISYLLIWIRKVNFTSKFVIMIKQVTANNAAILLGSVTYQCTYLIQHYYHRCIIIFATGSSHTDLNFYSTIALSVKPWCFTIPFSIVYTSFCFSEMFCVLQENKQW